MNIFRLFLRFGSLFKRDLIYVIGLAAVLNLFFGVTFYFVERDSQDISLLDSIWWAIVTMTTVGYGDFYAKTFIGRFVISYACMILGIGIIGSLIGVITSILIDLINRKRRGLMDIAFKNHVILCGYPNEKKIKYFIHEIKNTSKYSKCKMVLITEKLEELPEDIKTEISFIRGMPTDLDILHKANVKECKAVFVIADDPHDPRSDERTFVIGTLIESIEEEIKREINTIVEVVNANNIKNMKKMTINSCISIDGMISKMMVQELENPGIVDILSQIISSDNKNENIKNLKVKLLTHKR